MAAEITEKKRILVMEDQRDLHHVFTEMLEFLGYEVKICPNTEEILMAAKEEDFDILLLDLQFKVSREVSVDVAVDALAEIRKMGIETIAVLMTGDVKHPLVEDSQKLAEAGFELVITKPITLLPLRRVLEKALNMQEVECMVL